MNNVSYEDNKEVQVLTPGVKTSNNKEIRNNIQILKRIVEPIKVNINSGSEHFDIPEESESVQNGDSMNTKERNERNNANAVELRNTRNSAKKLVCSEHKIIVEGEVSMTKKGPDFIGESEKDLRHGKETEEDEDMEFNILQISKAGDLSPRHTDSLKNGATKGRPTIPLQVKTRSSRGNMSFSDQ
ncbi:hypothetical protein KY289_031660 [Solanum tuberosum]|nr:hypothetical protein KY289_031660 [Solanum tuberosum]